MYVLTAPVARSHITTYPLKRVIQQGAAPLPVRSVAPCQPRKVVPDHRRQSCVPVDGNPTDLPYDLIVDVQRDIHVLPLSQVEVDTDCIHFACGSVAYFAPDAPAFQEAGELKGDDLDKAL